MASTLLTPSIIAKEGLMQLDNNLVAAKMVYRAYETEFGETKIGDTLTIRRPVKYAIRTGSVAQMQDAAEGKVQIQINTQRGVDLRFPTKDLTLTIDRFSERYLKHPMIALANQVDLDVLSMFKYVWNWVGTPGQTLSGYKSFIRGPQRLDEMAVPAPRAACLSPSDFYGMASSFTGLYVADVAKTALEKSKLPMVGNPYLFLAQSAPLHDFPKGLIVDQLDVDIIPGVGITGPNPDAENPQLMLDWSDDGGSSWTGGRTASLGRVGERFAVASFYQLGSTFRAGRTFRLSSSSPVMRGILNADARVRPILA